ncbi:DUF2690 domain-containing protein [Streptomyces atriruber]|uniref:DUF2690 domain-containing protein n=1 Tax=Streptomyces atriruber TaxID=545121 RepID=A0ABV3BGX9_9ACTN
MKIQRFSAVFGAGVLAAGTLALMAPAAHAAPTTAAAPKGGCWNNGCTGKNPAAYCEGDARTVKSLRLGPAGGANAVLHLRYSPSCEAAWARLSSAPFDAANAKGGDAKVIRNSDGKKYSCRVPKGKASCYTKMVGDSGVTSYAWGDYDTSVYYYKGRTGSY